ncbi:MAG: DUF1638 domain-containing protein [Methylococcaceae bacterium]|nr:MAG: DUF1638 domain-containing protein [Methylococcaceae bacterium]
MTEKIPPVVVDQPLVLVGCGILHKEVDSLVQKNGWRVETQFLASSLHNYLDKLSSELNQALASNEQNGRETLVFYGSCHPLMDKILQQHHTLRTQGQNCIVMLLGYERFMEELGKGAYFLLEDWALTWEPMITRAFGKNQAVVREIFHGSHQFIIAIRTPCSTDFTAAAEAAARFVDLPLQWMDADLNHLESVLADAIAKKQQPAIR